MGAQNILHLDMSTKCDKILTRIIIILDPKWVVMAPFGPKLSENEAQDPTIFFCLGEGGVGSAWRENTNTKTKTHNKYSKFP